MILFIPLAMGGRTALGQLFLVVLAAGAAACWSLRQGLIADQGWIRSPAEWLVLGVLGLLGLQLVPLPAAWLAGLSPQVYKILPLWAPPTDGTATLGLWKTLSLTPAATRDGLVAITAFGLLFLTVVQRVRQPGDVERFLRWIALATLIMAVLALAQFFGGNGKFFWCFEHPYATTSDFVKGSFSNRNHFAHFVALGIGPWLWWICATWRRARASGAAAAFGQPPARSGTRIGLLAVGLAVIIFAGILSLSRGGIAAMLVAAATGLLIVYRAGRGNRKMLLALLGTAALTAACLLIYGYQSVAARLEDFSSVEQLDREHGRRKIWEADIKAIADFPAAGAGLGSHAAVYPLFLPEDEDMQSHEYTHAENGYLQIGLETGIPGLLLLGTALGLCVWWCVPAFRAGSTERIALCFAGVVPGLVASAVHAATDFVWYVPGCMVTPVILAACACRLRQIGNVGQVANLPKRRPEQACAVPAEIGTSERKGRNCASLFRPTVTACACRLRRIGWIAVAAALVGIGVMSAWNRVLALRAEPSWHRYLRIAGSSPPLDQLADWQTLQSMEEELSAVVRYQPDDAQAQLRLAAVQMQMFASAPDGSALGMDVRQVREAVTASHFPSVAARDEWLSRAFGARRGHLDAAARHARRAVAACPLQGEAYLYLAELSFLDGPSAPERAAFIDQALRVRPFDGAVLFAAGQEAAAHEKYPYPQAFQFWRASFQAGSPHQDRLIQALAGEGKIPAATLIDLLQPGLAGLARLVAYYQKHPSGDDLSVALEAYARAWESEARSKPARQAVAAWIRAANAYRDQAALGALNRRAEAIRCLREAIRGDSLSYQARLLLGSTLLDAKDYGEAVATLQWCVQQSPQDRTARSLLERALDGQLRSRMP